MSSKRKVTGGRPGGRPTPAGVVKFPVQVAGLDDDDMDDDEPFDLDRWREIAGEIRTGSGAARRLERKPDQAAAVGKVVAGVKALDRARDALRADVMAARGVGVSWAVVGLSLGITAEGARLHYGRTRSPRLDVGCSEPVD
jgi:hypothetical protein